MGDARRPREDGTRLLQRRIGIATAVLFLLAHVLAVLLLLDRWWHVGALGFWASGADRARVGFDPLLASMAGWGVLLAGLTVVWILRMDVPRGWSGEQVVLLLALLGGGTLVSAVPRVLGKPFEGTPPLLVPAWVSRSGDLAAGVGTVAVLVLLRALLRRGRRTGGSSAGDDVAFAGAFAVVAAGLLLHDAAIHGCVLYSVQVWPMLSLGTMVGARLLDSWGAIALGWLGCAGLALRLGTPGGPEEGEAEPA